MHTSQIVLYIGWPRKMVTHFYVINNFETLERMVTKQRVVLTPTTPFKTADNPVILIQLIIFYQF
jgi:hypothetical protein